MKLRGKTAAITGAAAGIGKAAALKFAEEGIKGLMLVDLNEGALADVVAEINKINSEVQVWTKKADVAKEEDVKAFIDETVKNAGGIDILFNNAGRSGASCAIDELPAETFRKTMEINMYSVFYGLKYALGYMKAAGKGSIISTASIGGLVALPGSIDYVAAKHAIVGMTKSAAVEYGPYGVRTNTICPGPITTDLYKGIASENAERLGITTEDFFKQDCESIPMARQGKPEEIADLVSFLASDESAYINGIAIAIDGGYTSL